MNDLRSAYGAGPLGYELVRLAGRGGMGEVWLARDRRSGRPCAIKLVRTDHKLDREARITLAGEARLASRIVHPNVAAVLDSGELPDGAPYLALEWVEGESLRAILAELPPGEGIPIAIALRIVSDACAGLHAAHELRGADGSPLELVHRDVSPHNILVSRTGETKLIDFGLAKARERIVADTSSGVIKGKVRYMAPEQALGARVDRRTDVFAMGAVLFQLLIGRAPFEGPNDVAILRALLSSKTPPLPQDLSLPLRNVLERALAPKEVDRFPTALAFAEALQEARWALRCHATSADVAAWVASRVAPVRYNSESFRPTAFDVVDPTVIDRRPPASLRRTRFVATLAALGIAIAISAGAFGVLVARWRTPVAHASVAAAPPPAVTADPPLLVAPPPETARQAPAPAPTMIPPAAKPVVRSSRAPAPPSSAPSTSTKETRAPVEDDDVASSLRQRR